jgi:hypothetical protein
MAEEKVLVVKNQLAINGIKSNLEALVKLLQQVVDAYNELGIGQLQNDEWEELLDGTQPFLNGKFLAMVERPVGGPFKMKDSALLASLELPDTTALKAAITKLQEAKQKQNGNGELYALTIEGDTVGFSQKWLDNQVEANCTYAVSDREKQILTVCQNVKTALEGLEEINGRPMWTYDNAPDIARLKDVPATYNKFKGR